MRLSQAVIHGDGERKIHQLLVQVIADVRSAEDTQDLLNNLLTETEKVAISKRLGIALLLTDGKSYDEIKQVLGVSSATVAKVQEMLDTPGIKIALSKIRDDRWASIWAKKFSDAIEKLVGKH